MKFQRSLDWATINKYLSDFLSWNAFAASSLENKNRIARFAAASIIRKSAHQFLLRSPTSLPYFQTFILQQK